MHKIRPKVADFLVLLNILFAHYPIKYTFNLISHKDHLWKNMKSTKSWICNINNFMARGRIREGVWAEHEKLMFLIQVGWRHYKDNVPPNFHDLVKQDIVITYVLRLNLITLSTSMYFKHLCINLYKYVFFLMVMMGPAWTNSFEKKTFALWICILVIRIWVEIYHIRRMSPKIYTSD